LAKKKSELGFVLTQNRQEDVRGKSRKIQIHQPLQAIRTLPKSQTASVLEDRMGYQSEYGTWLEDRRNGATIRSTVCRE
jgi:hypothetical protein